MWFVVAGIGIWVIYTGIGMGIGIGICGYVCCTTAAGVKVAVFYGLNEGAFAFCA